MRFALLAGIVILSPVLAVLFTLWVGAVLILLTAWAVLAGMRIGIEWVEPRLDTTVNWLLKLIPGS